MNEWIAFQLHARLPAFSRRVERARTIVGEALAASPQWYVALSGGKDSTVVLDLARAVQPTIPAVFSDDEWWLPETEAYLKRLKESGADLRWIRTNATHTEWFTPSGDWNGIPNYAKSQGWTGCFLGLRQDESSLRRVHLRHFGPLFFCQSDDCWHCSPLANWTTMDVWAYIASRGLDYNRAYDRLRDMDVPLAHRRIGPFAVDRALGYGQLALLKRGWPELFDRFAAAHPEARGYG